MNEDANISFRIWIDKNDTSYLGSGRITLLENIVKYGSINKACKSINMSYRKAWQLVENMNRLADKPLVKKRLGGKGGGGAIVTKEGLFAIKRFHELHGKIEKFIVQTQKEFQF